MYLRAIGVGSGQTHHHQTKEHHNHADDCQDERDQTDLRRRFVQATKVRCNGFDAGHNIIFEQTADFRNGVHFGYSVETQDSISARHISPILSNNHEVGNGLGQARSGCCDCPEHSIFVANLRVLGHERQQVRNLGTHLIQRQRQQQMICMRKIGFECGKYIRLRESSGTCDQPHQIPDLARRATFSVDNRVDHVGHIANHRDSDPVADDSLLGK